MNEEFEKFVLERQSTEHELMYGLKPEDWEWQLAAAAYLAGTAAGYTKGVAVMKERCAEVAEADDTCECSCSSDYECNHCAIKKNIAAAISGMEI